MLMLMIGVFELQVPSMMKLSDSKEQSVRESGGRKENPHFVIVLDSSLFPCIYRET